MDNTGANPLKTNLYADSLSSVRLVLKKGFTLLVEQDEEGLEINLYPPDPLNIGEYSVEGLTVKWDDLCVDDCVLMKIT